MSGVIDFTGVDAAASKPFTRPGVIDVFTITKVEFESAKKSGVPMMKITFENDDSGFPHRFMLDAKDKSAEKRKKVLSRIQSLSEAATGEKLSGGITEQSLKLKFEGKKLALKVIGEVSDQGKGFPALSFGGFCAPAAEVKFLAFSVEEQRKVDAALEAIESGGSSTADSESGGGYSSTEDYGSGATEQPTSTNF